VYLSEISDFGGSVGASPRRTRKTASIDVEILRKLCPNKNIYTHIMSKNMLKRETERVSAYLERTDGTISIDVEILRLYSCQKRRR